MYEVSAQHHTVPYVWQPHFLSCENLSALWRARCRSQVRAISGRDIREIGGRQYIVEELFPDHSSHRFSWGWRSVGVTVAVVQFSDNPGEPHRILQKPPLKQS